MGESDKRKDEKKGELFDLLNLKIFGISIGELIRDIDEVRERILSQREELQKKLGDKVRIDFEMKVGGLGKMPVTSGDTLWNNLIRERAEWKRQAPLLKITKEDIKRAEEELEKEKRKEKESEEKDNAK